MLSHIAAGSFHCFSSYVSSRRTGTGVSMANHESQSLPTGRVSIADGAIMTIVHEAVLSCYGIVDMERFATTFYR